MQARSRDTVAVIVEGAARVFERLGYDGTTNHIAKEAGVSVGSVYQYFPNKDALLLALARRHLDRGRDALRAVADELRADPPPLADVVRRFIEAAAGLHRDYPRGHRLFEEMLRDHAELIEQAMALKHSLTADLAWHVRRERPDLDDVDTRVALAVSALGAGVHDVISERADDERAIEALARMCAAAFET